MTYFVWQRGKGSAGKLAYFTKEPAGFSRADWITGAKSKRKLPELTFAVDEENEGDLTDQLLTRAQVPVFSPKLRTVLAESGAKNLEYYPARVLDHNGNVIGTGYETANVIGLIACLDEKNAQCTFVAKKMTGLEEFKLHENKIVATPDMGGKAALIFRLAEFPSMVLVHESVKKQIEKAGITGVRFTPPESYTSGG